MVPTRPTVALAGGASHWTKGHDARVRAASSPTRSRLRSGAASCASRRSISRLIAL
jgi:hypothetical protein